MAGLHLPKSKTRWVLRNARVPTAVLTDIAALGGDGVGDAEGLIGVDVAIDGDRIEAVTPAGAGLFTDRPMVDRGGTIVLPCFVDAHTHLDKGHVWPRAANPDGTRDGAIAAVMRDREAHWTAEDVAARMEFSVACAYAHGTSLVRTHLDSVKNQTRITWPVFAELADRWRARITLRASPLFGIETALDEAHMRDISDMLALAGPFGGCVGAVTYPGPALLPGLRAMFRFAADRGCDLDFHVDETGDPTINTLAVIAEEASAFGFPGKILVGHCCALAVYPEDERQDTIEKVLRAGIAVVSLPMCNMYLQSRGGEFPPYGRSTPRWRGTTAYKELARAGVPVMIASDNTRDPFFAYGDLDMAEVWREGSRILHLDHPYHPWVTSVTRTAADRLGFDELGRIAVGGPADLILFEARSLSEWMARPQMRRIVIRHGRPIDTTLPDYARLDGLQGLAPRAIGLLERSPEVSA